MLAAESSFVALPAALMVFDGFQHHAESPAAEPSIGVKLAALLRETGRFEEAAAVLKSPADIVPVSRPGSMDVPIDQRALFEPRDHVKSMALAGDVDAAINDFRIELERYPSQSKELAGFATIVAESLSTRPQHGQIAAERFYSRLVEETPTLLESEIFSSNIVVSAKRLQLEKLLVQRVEMFEERFPNSTSSSKSAILTIAPIRVPIVVAPLEGRERLIHLTQDQSRFRSRQPLPARLA
ncbi:MAG: hypothetical protein H0T47_11315 [Planctomycetaceae bacterium]|nr:hypothetical protein [Planctomycetaceae bacterium]